jgi:hypothetical protein
MTEGRLAETRNEGSTRRRRLGQARRRSAPRLTGDPSGVPPAPATRAVTHSREADALGAWLAATGGARRSRRSARLVELAVLLAGLVALPFALAWIVDEQPGVGPVLLVLAPGHGIHAFDLVLLAGALPAWWWLASRTRRWVRRRRSRHVARRGTGSARPGR